MDFKTPDISIILPVYNCVTAFKKSIGTLREILFTLAEDNEVIVVNDGSEIDYEEINECAVKNNCALITYRQNKGKGYAVTQGIKAASGKYIIYMDGDFPFDLSVIKIAYKNISRQGVDMIIGDRTLPASSYAEAPFIRSAGSKILSFLVSNYVTPGFYDTQCGVKGFKRNVAQDIFSQLTISGFSFDVEVIFIAVKKKYTIIKIPFKGKKEIFINGKINFSWF